jgi:hypothetical protein
MVLTLSEITPIGLCIATQDLFDAKRFQANFCDNLLLRVKNSMLGPKLTMLKRELNSTMTQGKFLDGHKTAIISNIDKILGMVSSRYSQSDMKAAGKIIEDGQELISKIISSNSFEDIAALEPVFKTKITFPVYELFVSSMKKSKVQMI